MKVLFDHNVPKKLRTLLPGHAVSTSRELGWDTLRNGDLLTAAEANGFEVMVTADKNISYQQKTRRPQTGSGRVAHNGLGNLATEPSSCHCRAERSYSWKLHGPSYSALSAPPPARSLLHSLAAPMQSGFVYVFSNPASLPVRDCQASRRR